MLNILSYQYSLHVDLMLISCCILGRVFILPSCAGALLGGSDPKQFFFSSGHWNGSGSFFGWRHFPVLDQTFYVESRLKHILTLCNMLVAHLAILKRQSLHKLCKISFSITNKGFCEDNFLKKQTLENILVRHFITESCLQETDDKFSAGYVYFSQQ